MQESSNTMIESYVREQLFLLRDLKYRDFNSKLIPNIDPQKVIGIRTPELRKFAHAFAKTDAAAEFLRCLPHTYHEENQLHGEIISLYKDYNTAIDAVNRFLPYIDNWATCDMLSPKVFKKHLPELLEHIKVWLGSNHEYTVRFGIKMLMDHYLDEAFDAEYPEMVSSVRREEYYIRMVIAWYFATALAKQYDHAIVYIEERRLDPWTHNKTIQKAIESYRVTDEHKEYLRKLKV